MLFNSVQFLIFFPVVLLLYYVLPEKTRKYMLLIASFYFYMSWSFNYVFLILFSIIVTYLGSIYIDKINASDKQEKSKKRSKNLIILTVLSTNLLILFVFKYFNFFFARLFQIINFTGANLQAPYLNWLLPVGISFYTFQALSYTIDVYKGTIKAERRFVNYALFVSFFPQLVAGPIERSGNLLPQLNNLKGFDFENFKQGLKLMLFGFFQKIVIADNIAAIVNTVYENPSDYYGAQILIATVLFAFQIYCDFAGYSNIAIGCAKCMGIKLMQNFKTPYFARSVREFWRRWHISLSTWFKDYLYIPLGGNRKGKTRTYINIIIVFAVSGLWHGAELTFLFWGLLHGAYQIIEILSEKHLSRAKTVLKIKENGILNRATSLLLTFVLVDFAWIFFRANSLSDSIIILKNMFNFDYYTSQYFDITALGVDERQAIIILVSFAILFVCSYLQYSDKTAKLSAKIPEPLKWAGYIAAVNYVLVFGNYSLNSDVAQQFIYFQF